MSINLCPFYIFIAQLYIVSIWIDSLGKSIGSANRDRYGIIGLIQECIDVISFYIIHTIFQFIPGPQPDSGCKSYAFRLWCSCINQINIVKFPGCVQQCCPRRAWPYRLFWAVAPIGNEPFRAESFPSLDIVLRLEFKPQCFCLRSHRGQCKGNGRQGSHPDSSLEHNHPQYAGCAECNALPLGVTRVKTFQSQSEAVLRLSSNRFGRRSTRPALAKAAGAVFFQAPAPVGGVTALRRSVRARPSDILIRDIGAGPAGRQFCQCCSGARAKTRGSLSQSYFGNFSSGGLSHEGGPTVATVARVGPEMVPW